MNWRERWNLAGATEQINVILTGAIALFTLINVIATIAYVSTVRQAGEEAAIQTDKLIYAANTQTAAAQKFAESSDQIKIQIIKAVGDFETAANQSSQASALAAQNTIRSMKASQDSFREQQRAWLGLKETTVLQLGDNIPLRVKVPLHNSGRSPAINAQQIVVFGYYDRIVPEPDPAEIRKVARFEPIGAVPPDGAATIQIDNPTVGVHYQRLLARSEFLYLVGVVRYNDVYSNVVHTTRYCLVLTDLNPNQFSICAAGNDMD